MKKFKFKITSEFEETIDNIISCLLPHENFSVTEAKGVIEELYRTLPLEETSGIYYVFLTIIKRLNITRLYMHNYTTVLNRDVFEHAILGGLHDLILNEDFDATVFFGTYGRNFDLNIQTQNEEASSFLYSILLNKYDELFAKAVPTAEGLSWIAVLKDSMKYELVAKMLSISATILTEGYTQERRLLRGPDDTLKFMSEALADVNSRIQDIFSDTGSRFSETELTSLNISKEFDSKNRIQTKTLYYMGIDPIDDVMPIRTQDIVTFIADEGIGKTRIMVDQAYRAILAGANVLYICGETAKIKIKKYIEAAHIYSMYDLQLRWTEVDDPSTIEGITEEQLEDYQIKINAALADLYENATYGKLILLQSASYENFADVIHTNKDKHNIDLVIVDHVLALSSTGEYTTSGRLNTKSARVSYLYECEDILVKECNIAFLNTSHPSVQTSQDLKMGKAPSARSGAESADSTRYSSAVFVLNNDAKLRKQDLVLLYVTKLRDEANTSDAIVLKRLGYSNIHVFDPQLQYIGNSNTADDIDIDALYMDNED